MKSSQIKNEVENVEKEHLGLFFVIGSRKKSSRKKIKFEVELNAERTLTGSGRTFRTSKWRRVGSQITMSSFL